MNKIGKIGFLGGGKIAQAMAKGFISAGISRDIYIVEEYVEIVLSTIRLLIIVRNASL